MSFLLNDSAGADETDVQRRRRLGLDESPNDPTATPGAPGLTPPATPPATSPDTTPPIPSVGTQLSNPTAPKGPEASPAPFAPPTGAPTPTPTPTTSPGIAPIPSVGGMVPQTPTPTPSPYAPPSVAPSAGPTTAVPDPVSPPPQLPYGLPTNTWEGTLGGTPTPQNTLPPAPAAAPAGFTQGSGPDSGSFYYGGNKVSLVGGRVMYDDPSGITHTMDGGALQSFINSPTFAQSEAQRGAAAQYAGATPEIKAALTAAAGPDQIRTQLAARLQNGEQLSPDEMQQYEQAVTQENGVWNPVIDNAMKNAAPSALPAQSAERYLVNGEVVDASGNLMPAADQQQRTINGVTTPYRNPDANPGAMQADPETLRQLAAAGITPQGTAIPAVGGDFQNPRSPTPAPALPGGSLSGSQTGGPIHSPPVGPAPDTNAGGQLPIPGTPGSIGANGISTAPIGSSGPSNAPPGELSTFGPGHDLQSTQINPAASSSLSNLDAMVSNAAGAVGNGKSRGDIAQGYLDAFDQSAQPKIRDQIRAVGQKAASLGRLGMGDTAVETLQPYTDYLTQRSAYEKQLASDSASGDITDRLNTLGALNSTQNQTYGQEANARNELRTERGYQTSSSQQAIQNAIQQFLMEQQAQAQNFSQGSTLAGVGYGNSPENLYFGAGQQYGQNAGLDFQALAQMLGPYLYGGNRS